MMETETGNIQEAWSLVQAMAKQKQTKFPGSSGAELCKVQVRKENRGGTAGCQHRFIGDKPAEGVSSKGLKPQSAYRLG